MKRKLLPLVFIPLLVVALLLTGCPTAKTTTADTTQQQITALQGVVSQMQSDLAALRADMRDAVDAADEVGDIDDRLDDFESDLNAIAGDILSLKEDVASLKIGGGSGSGGSPSGKLTVEITDAWGCDFEEGETALYGIYSSEALASYRFTVSITNNIDESRWIYISLSLSKDSGAGGTGNVASAKLTNLTYGALTYTQFTNLPAPMVITFTPNSSTTRFSVGKGKAVDVDFILEITMAAGGGYAFWDGNLSYSVKTQP